MIVDAHVHVGGGKYPPISDYRVAMAESGIGAAVLVQNLGNSDNRYLLDVLRSDPARFAGVAIVDRASDADAVLAAGFAGLRVAPSGLPDGSGAEVFDVLASAGAVASVTGPFPDVVSDAFAALVADRPRLHVRLEHLGWFRYQPGSPDVDAFDRLLALAALPNVTVMWSGFFANAGTPYPYPDARPYLDRCLEAFGSERTMWSGDWNRAGLAPGEYSDAVTLALTHWGLSGAQAADVLGGTAARVFGLSAATEGVR
ncbi:amidohydrolase [Jiangella sp. DSM 45060]|uniref:amidohydrolase family protein n=1 Tax=Jiangella sp. DSM 45060 TaxID=1798224 RepID=UPI00087C17ED|nr:amidohydrolase family protein [Jiangella sp. DSM 45060]SDT08355.1 Predicted metal-dependent hydrolase, TIM-barrel fold [Jiangella sp. DSM 45060]